MLSIINTSKCCEVLLILCALSVVSTAFNSTQFLVKNILPDGEIETRIRYNDISAKETTVSSRSDMRITLRQLTDGQHFIQLIYDERDNIRDCEYLHDRGQIKTFLKKFQNDLDNLTATSNITINSIDQKHIPKGVRKWLNYSKLKSQCRKSHKAMKKALRENKSKKDKEEHNQGRSRIREPRAISDYFMAPGTLWCGPEHIANSYTDLGGMSLTDKCCRKHDHCKMNIHGFTQKYNYYNAKPFTISHCWCDNSFRACLKMADTSDANLVGKLFFNIVQTKCFVLKPKKVCLRRSWWGKCTKKKYMKQAILRDNLSY